MDNGSRNDALEALRGLWKRRRRPALIVFLFLAIPAAALVVGLPSIYQAQATILVERENLPATVSRPVPARADEVETRIRALAQTTLSRARLRELIDTHDLYRSFRGREGEEQIIKRMRTDIALSLDRKAQGDASPTVVVTLAYRGPDGGKVADVTNALSGYFVEGRGEERFRQATETAALLQAQLKLVEEKMIAQEKVLGSYKARHGTDLPEQLPANLAALQRLNQQLQLNGEWQIRAAERREAAAQRAAVVAGPGTAADPQFQMQKLHTDLQNLRSRYSESHPDVARLRGELNALQKAPPPPAPPAASPPAPSSSTSAATEAEIRVLREQEAGLKRSISSYQSRVEAAPTREQEIQELSRNYEATKALYASLYQRETEARLAGTLEEHQAGERFRILDPAIRPSSPQGPDRLRLLFLVFAAAFGASVAVALVLERVDTTFHSLDQLRSATPVTVVGSLPRLRTTAQTVRQNLAAVFGTLAGIAALAVLSGATYWVARGNEGLASLALKLGS